MILITYLKNKFLRLISYFNNIDFNRKIYIFTNNGNYNFKCKI